MDRSTATNAIVSLAGLLAEGTAQANAKDEEIAQLRLALAQEKHNTATHIRKANDELSEQRGMNALLKQDVNDLRQRLQAEEQRRASFQSVDAAARRFTERFVQENPRQGWAAGWRCPGTEMKALLVATGAMPDADNGR